MLLFTPGQLVATPGALEALEKAGQQPFQFLHKHLSGDWGIMCEEDKRANNRALAVGERLMSAYTTSKGDTIWIITEWDRSVTTILLPKEY